MYTGFRPISHPRDGMMIIYYEIYKGKNCMNSPKTDKNSRIEIYSKCACWCVTRREHLVFFSFLCYHDWLNQQTPWPTSDIQPKMNRFDSCLVYLAIWDDSHWFVHHKHHPSVDSDKHPWIVDQLTENGFTKWNQIRADSEKKARRPDQNLLWKRGLH